MTTATFLPAMYTVKSFAAAHAIGESKAYELIRATQWVDGWPPLKAKRIRKPGSKKSALYITQEAAAEWRALLADA